MVVRIRISTGFPRIQGKTSGDVAVGLAGLLTLISVVCFAMSVWKLCAEMGWAGQFVIASGVFSHWQIWIGCAVASQLVSFRLSRPRPLIS